MKNLILSEVLHQLMLMNIVYDVIELDQNDDDWLFAENNKQILTYVKRSNFFN
jgi:hypothetical protein